MSKPAQYKGSMNTYSLKIILLCKRRIHQSAAQLNSRHILDDVCDDVEPKLQPLEGETFDNKSTSTEDEARLDIKAY